MKINYFLSIGSILLIFSQLTLSAQDNGKKTNMSKTTSNQAKKTNEGKRITSNDKVAEYNALKAKELKSKSAKTQSNSNIKSESNTK